MDQDFLRDPRSLPLAQRQALLQTHTAAQRSWLDRLRRLAEPPAPGDDFPAFLLALPPFSALAQRLSGAACRADLGTATADELDHFVRAYRDYLRTCAGEDVFPGSRRAS